MGKISDALSKVMREREVYKKQGSAPAPVEAPETESIPKVVEETLPESALATIDRTISLRKRLREVKIGLEDRLRHRERINIVDASDDSGIDPRVVTYHNYHSPLAEQYRSLRIHVKAFFKKAAPAGKIKTVTSTTSPRVFVISSAVQGEGKTVTAVNLGVSLANEFETRVLLVDCDLRKGSIDTLLHLWHKPGLFDLIAGKALLPDVIHPTKVDNLFVIPTGDTPLKPSELLSSKRMRIILEQLRSENFSYIILDTPPALPFSDAGILGSQVDGVVMVIKSQQTQANVVKRAIDSLEHAHAKVLGCVLTNVEQPSPKMYGHYYYYYSSKDNGKKKKEQAPQGGQQPQQPQEAQQENTNQ